MTERGFVRLYRCQPIGKPLARSTNLWGDFGAWLDAVSADRKAVGQIDVPEIKIQESAQQCQPIGKPLARSTRTSREGKRPPRVSADRKAVGQIDVLRPSGWGWVSQVSADRKAVGQIDPRGSPLNRTPLSVSRSESRWPDRQSIWQAVAADLRCQPIGKPLARSTSLK